MFVKRHTRIIRSFWGPKPKVKPGLKSNAILRLHHPKIYCAAVAKRMSRYNAYAVCGSIFHILLADHMNSWPILQNTWNWTGNAEEVWNDATLFVAAEPTQDTAGLCDRKCLNALWIVPYFTWRGSTVLAELSSSESYCLWRKQTQTLSIDKHSYIFCDMCPW